MNNIWLGELIVVYICLTALWTYHVFQKTGSVNDAFVKGFAAGTSIATLVFVAIYVPDEWIPNWLDDVLLPLLAAAAVLATLTYGRYMMLLLRNNLIKTGRVLRKVWGKAIGGFWTHRLSFTSKNKRR